MRYLHQLTDWPNFTWEKQRVSESLARARFEQGRLIGRLESLDPEGQARADVTVLSRGIVASSAIENEHLELDQVKDSVVSQKSGKSGSRRPVSNRTEGAVAVVMDATKGCKDKLTKSRLFQWHRWLFAEQDDNNSLEVGQWRSSSTGRMRVVSKRGDGSERIHFEAPKPGRVSAEMTQFLNWFDESRTSGEIDPVLIAGVAHLYFLTVHPFQDGNGRIARAISEMSLAESDQSTHRFYSLSAQIEMDRAEYYTELELSQKSPDLDITDWLLWFVGCFRRAILSAETLIEQTLRDAKFKTRIQEFGPNPRQTKILESLLAGFNGKLTSSKYAKIAKCSQDTAVRDINALVNGGLLEPSEAGGRSRSYSVTN